MSLNEFDRRLIRATQAGLPLVPRPYEAVGAILGVSGEEVRERLQTMLETGLIRRIGAVPNHYRLGFTANGMSVWDVDDALVDELGARIGDLPGVSHCYRRPRRLPVWPTTCSPCCMAAPAKKSNSRRSTSRACLATPAHPTTSFIPPPS